MSLKSAETRAVVVPAWDLIGHEGKFRLVGGHRIYEGVMYDLRTARSNRVRLAYLVADERGLRQINRYVDPDTPVEVIEDFDADPSEFDGTVA